VCREALSIHFLKGSAKIVCEADHIAFWGQNERKIDSLISEMLVQKASDISACVMYLCKEQMFPL